MMYQLWRFCLSATVKLHNVETNGICKTNQLIVQLSVSDFQSSYVIFSAPMLVKA